MTDRHAPPAHDHETSSTEIIDPRSEGKASGHDVAGDDGGDHDPVSAPSAFPSPAPLIPNDAGPLLGITSTNTEKAGLISGNDEDSNPSPGYAPLLGTICSEIAENSGKSSSGRSPKSVCYTGLLHSRGGQSPLTVRKDGQKRRAGCYTRLLHNRHSGLILRGSIFYLRRRVPHDLVAIVGKAEIWKSLRTES